MKLQSPIPHWSKSYAQLETLKSRSNSKTMVIRSKVMAPNENPGLKDLYEKYQSPIPYGLKDVKGGKSPRSRSTGQNGIKWKHWF